MRDFIGVYCSCLSMYFLISMSLCCLLFVFMCVTKFVVCASEAYVSLRQLKVFVIHSFPTRSCNHPSILHPSAIYPSIIPSSATYLSICHFLLYESSIHHYHPYYLANHLSIHLSSTCFTICSLSSQPIHPSSKYHFIRFEFSIFLYCLSICLSIPPFIYPFFHLSIHPSFLPSIRPSSYQHTHQPNHPPIHLIFIYLIPPLDNPSNHPYVIPPSFNPSINHPLYPFI